MSTMKSTQPVYSGPATTYSMVNAAISMNYVVTALWKEGTWVCIQYDVTADKRRGFVPASAVNITEPSVPTFTPTNYTRYVAGNTTTYNGPSSSGYPTVATLTSGTVVSFLNKNEGSFALIEYTLSGSQKTRSYINSANLQLVKPTLTLAQLKSKFPHGKYWNRMGLSANNQDGYTSTQCSNHGNTNNCNHYNPGTSDLASQCLGFALKCGYDSTGYDPLAIANGWSSSESSSSLDSLKAGDIVRYTTATNEHSIFVTGVSGDTVTYGDCNGTGKPCEIRWGATISKATLKSKFVKLRSAPKTLI